MPFVNIYTIEKNIASLKSLIQEIKEFVAKKLSCKERVLNSNEISIRLIVPSTSSQIAETELTITAYPYPERIKEQDKICLEIRNFIISNANIKSVYVWLQLCELGHSSEQ